MNEPQQQVDAFAVTLMEQRNAALNEAAYWKAQAIKLQAENTELKAKLPEPKEEKAAKK